MKNLKSRVQRTSDRLLDLLAPKATAQAQPGQWCRSTGIHCGWPKYRYYDVVKGTDCGCW